MAAPCRRWRCAAPCWQSHLGPRARWGAPPVVVEGGFGLGVRWKGCRRGGREIKAGCCCDTTKKPALGNGLISCLQARRGGRWARFLQPAAHRSSLPLYQPPSPAIPTRSGHRAASVQERLSADLLLCVGTQGTCSHHSSALAKRRSLLFAPSSNSLLHEPQRAATSKPDRQQST